MESDRRVGERQRGKVRVGRGREREGKGSKNSYFILFCTSILIGDFLRHKDDFLTRNAGNRNGGSTSRFSLTTAAISDVN